MPALAVPIISEVKMHTLIEIQNWFKEQCDGWWENDACIKIETCDNPGWWVQIKLKGTKLENKSFKPVKKSIPKELEDQALGLVEPLFVCASPTSADDWLMCHVRDQKFNGAGDPSKLEEILNIFLNWVKSHAVTDNNTA